MKFIKNFEDKYAVDETGNIYSVNYRNKKDNIQILKPRINRLGRKYINLCMKGKYKSYMVHRLIAETFLIKDNPDHVVNHKDGNKLNNCVSNLEWISIEDNFNHAVLNNLYSCEFNNHNCKISNDDVLLIRDHLCNLYSSRQIAKMYNCSKTTISYIINNKRRLKI